MNTESPQGYRKASVVMPPKLDFSGLLSKNGHKKSQSLFGSFRPMFTNPIPQETPTTDEQAFSFEEDYMRIPTEREDDEFRSKLDTMRSHIKTYNLETQEAESFLDKDRDREPVSSNRQWDAAWTDGLSRGRMLDSRLIKLEFSELEDLEMSPLQIMLTETNRDAESAVTKDNMDTERGLGKRVTWGAEMSARTKAESPLDMLASVPLKMRHSDASSISLTESKNWKKAKKTFTAMKFSIGAEEAVEKKITNVMKGVKAQTFEASKILEKKKRIFIINPKNNLKMLWDFLIYMVLLYYSVAAPYRWSQKIKHNKYLSLDLALDCLTLVDILLNFITGIPKTNGIVKDIKVISTTYLKTFFLIDFVAMLPLYLISSHFYILKFFRTIRLVKTHNFLRKFCFQIHFRGLDAFKILRMFFILIIVVNLLICFWIFLGKTVTFDETWLGDQRYDDLTALSTLANLYIEVCVFVVATITTVGYSTMMMTNFVEQLATMLFMLSGNLLIGFLQSQFIYFIYTNTNVQNKIRKEDLNLERWLAQREQFHQHDADDSYKKFFSFLDNTLHETIQGIYSFFRSNRAFNYQNLTYNVGFFQQLAPNVQEKIIQESFSGLINKFHLFFDTVKDPSFNKELISNLRLKIFPSYKKIVRRGGPLKGLYFIMKGKMLLSYDNILLLSFGEGSFFGESILIDRNIDLEYIACQTAKNEGLKCLYLPRHFFLDLCYRYPHVLSRLQEIAMAREEFFEKKCAQAYRTIRSTVQRLHRGTTLQNQPIPEQSEKEEAEDAEEQDVSIGNKPMEAMEAMEPMETKPTERDEAPTSRPLLNLNAIVLDDNTGRANKNIVDGITPESCNFSRITDRGGMSFKHFERSNPGSQTGKTAGGVKWDSHAFDATVDEKMTPQAFKHYLDQLFECKSPSREEVSPLKKPGASQTSVMEIDGIFKIVENEEDKRGEKTTKSVKSVTKLYRDSNKGDESDDDDHELDNSMEIPVDLVDPTFEETDESDMIIEYLQKRVELIQYKMERLKKVFREDLINDWKKLNKLRKHVETESEEFD